MPLLQNRKRRAEPEPDEDEDGASSPEPATQRRRPNANRNDVDDTAFGGDDGIHAHGDSSLDQMVKKLVRLALACEYQRRPIRRGDISEKVLGTAGRQFKHVFAQAQVSLRTVFGMEMVELPAREKVTLAQRRAAAKTADKSKTAASWVLISVLPTQFRDPEILQPPAAPTAEEESKYASVYTLLIALISLSGGSLPDAKMDRYLRRVQMEDNTPIATHAKTELLLKRMEKDGYIVKIKESTGTGEEDVSWTVGPRGKVEVGEDGVRGLTRTVYGELDEAKDEDLERRIARSLGMGEKVAPRQEKKKKKGRKRRGAPEEEDEEEVGGDTEEDEE
ncbi:hypothetical protein LTR36_009561 [Oleoguttula mirabilis]|uniref:MAGE domain-containing protein n=1 Tax=Oleoguttula mirabilis TaxID=1507867 RepID=A0AAV9JSL5_9PEZI|nr:hypothetical protein LTR36_009561 [Oleoguttula mirabilis]